MEKLAVPGLVSRVIYGWTGSAPGFAAMAREGRLQGWNMPLGVVSHMIRDCAARRPGSLSHVGLGTFVDPRQGGGRLSGQTEELVQLVSVEGQEKLFYKVRGQKAMTRRGTLASIVGSIFTTLLLLFAFQSPPRIDVALLRGSTADEDGNVTMDREALLGDVLNQASR